MTTFTDAEGRQWSLKFNVRTIKSTLDKTGVDLMGLTSDEMKPLHDLVTSPVKFADVLWCLCEKQAEAKGIEGESFFDGLSGEAIVSAVDPFVDAITDFIHPHQKQMYLKMYRKLVEVSEALVGIANAELDGMTVQELAEKVIGSASSLQGS